MMRGQSTIHIEQRLKDDRRARGLKWGCHNENSETMYGVKSMLYLGTSFRILMCNHNVKTSFLWQHRDMEDIMFWMQRESPTPMTFPRHIWQLGGALPSRMTYSRHFKTPWKNSTSTWRAHRVSYRLWGLPKYQITLHFRKTRQPIFDGCLRTRCRKTRKIINVKAGFSEMKRCSPWVIR